MKTNDEIERAYENDRLDDLTAEELDELNRILSKKVIYKNFGKFDAPKPKIPDYGSSKGGSNMGVWYNSYIKRYDIDKDATDDITFRNYFENTDSDTGCKDDVSSWSPEDSYTRAIWHTFLATSNLFQVAVKGIDIRQGQGLSVQIRTIGAFDDPVEKASCECGSCASISFSSYTLTLKQYNMESIICDKDIWDVGGELMDSYIEAMAEKWTAWFDAQIYSELETASPGNTETLVSALSCSPAMSGSCCSDSDMVNFYNSIQNAVTTMKESNYKPNYMIVSPSVAKVLKSFSSNAVPEWVNQEIQFNSNGELKRAAGLKVIEYNGANSCTDSSGEVVAIIVDSRRAVGAAFGQRPQMYKFFQSNCNSYRIDWWSYFAVAELDTNAICHIVNP